MKQLLCRDCEDWKPAEAFPGAAKDGRRLNRCTDCWDLLALTSPQSASEAQRVHMRHQPDVMVTIHAGINGRVQPLPLARVTIPSPEAGPALIADILRDLADAIENDTNEFDAIMDVGP